MESFGDFVIARYNYWIVIILMMTGLYTVVARGNLVKKVVGLNLFQTSVFIFYITIGKVAGGTAPIYVGGEEGHGGDHGDDHGDGHGDDGADRRADGEISAGEHHLNGDAGGPLANAKIENDPPTNDLKAAFNRLQSEAREEVGDAASLHAAPDAGPDVGAKISNDQLLGVGKPEEAARGFDLAINVQAADGSTLDSAASLGEVVYSNPLPHVLILTAIVVGVAGTAVGLALAVRIREAYGTIEEDELEQIDNVAEFGDAADLAAAGAPGAGR